MHDSAVRLLEDAAERFPDRPALECGERTLNYTQYRAAARSVAAELLRTGGCGAARPVAVLLPKGIEAVTSFMGALYAGCPYVPVDYAAPGERLKKIMANLRPGHIITDAKGAERLRGCGADASLVRIYADIPLPDGCDATIDAAWQAVGEQDTVYIMYTSGSTGTPKGVAVPHRGVTLYADWIRDTFHFDETAVICGVVPLFFDISVFDIYGALRCGGKLLLAPESLMHFPVMFPEFFEEKGVTAVFWVPTVMIYIANSGVLQKHPMPRMRVVAFGGEIMPNRQLNIWRRAMPECAFANIYGPTETDACTCYIADRDFDDMESLPIGGVIPGMEIEMLDSDGRPVPRGETGELCVRSPGMTTGYWNAPELTDRAFFPGYDGGGRFYRTGDLACFAPDGLIMFLGRKDGLVKIKGNRVELGEIEAAAREIDGVQNCCALFDLDAEEITLFLETDRGWELRPFNRELMKFVPRYMLPARLVCMKKLPHTPNDKIDRVYLRKTYIENRERQDG